MSDNIDIKLNIEGNFEDAMQNIAKSLEDIKALIEGMATSSTASFGKFNQSVVKMAANLKNARETIRRMKSELKNTGDQAKKAGVQLRGFFTQRGFGFAGRLGETSLTDSISMGLSGTFTEMGHTVAQFGKTLGRAFSNAASSAINSFAQIGPALTQSLGSAISAIVKFGGQTIKSVADIAAGLAQSTGQAITGIVSTASYGLSAIALGFGDVIGAVSAQAIRTIVNTVVKLSSTAAESIAKLTGSLVKGIADFVGPMIGAITNVVTNIASKLAQGVAGILSKTITFIVSGISKALGAIPGLLSPILNKVTALIVGGLGVAAIKSVDDTNVKIYNAYSLLEENLRGTMDRMKNMIRSTAEELPVSTAKMGDALFRTFSLGFKDYDVAAEILKASAKLATAGNVEDQLSGVNAAMLKLNQTFPEAFKSWGEEADKLFAIMQYGDVTIQDLAVQMPRLTMAAKTAGIEFGEMSAAWSLLTKYFGSSEQATTRLGAAFTSLARTSRLAVQWQAHYNVKLFEMSRATKDSLNAKMREMDLMSAKIIKLKQETDLTSDQRRELAKLEAVLKANETAFQKAVVQGGKFVGMTRAIAELKTKLAGEENLFGALVKLTANKQAAEALATLITRYDDYKHILGEIEQAHGRVDSALSVQMKSINKNFTILYNTAVNVAAELVDFFSKDIVDALKICKEWLAKVKDDLHGWLHSEGFEKFSKSAKEAFSLVGKVAVDIFETIKTAARETATALGLKGGDFSLGEGILRGLRTAQVEIGIILYNIRKLIEGKDTNFKTSFIVTGMQLGWEIMKKQAKKAFEEVRKFAYEIIADIAERLSTLMSTIAVKIQSKGIDIMQTGASFGAQGHLKGAGGWGSSFSEIVMAGMKDIATFFTGGSFLAIDQKIIGFGKTVKGTADKVWTLSDALKGFAKETKEAAKTSKSFDDEMKKSNALIEDMKEGFLNLVGFALDAAKSFVTVEEKVNKYNAAMAKFESFTSSGGRALVATWNYIAEAIERSATSVGKISSAIFTVKGIGGDKKKQTGGEVGVKLDHQDVRKSIDASANLTKLLQQGKERAKLAKQYQAALKALMDGVQRAIQKSADDETLGRWVGTKTGLDHDYSTGRSLQLLLKQLTSKKDILAGTGKWDEELATFDKQISDAGLSVDKLSPKLQEYRRQIEENMRIQVMAMKELLGFGDAAGRAKIVLEAMLLNAPEAATAGAAPAGAPGLGEATKKEIAKQQELADNLKKEDADQVNRMISTMGELRAKVEAGQQKLTSVTSMVVDGLTSLKSMEEEHFSAIVGLVTQEKEKIEEIHHNMNAAATADRSLLETILQTQDAIVEELLKLTRMYERMERNARAIQRKRNM